MDHQAFDRLARLLGEAADRRSGLRAVFGALLGAGGAAAALGAEAKRRGTDAHGATGGGEAEKRRKRRRRTCKPACGAGFDCVKGTCVCPSGVECGGGCCAAGESCRNGACASDPGPPPEPTCIAAGEPCKNAGRPCCDGRVCASGQGGDGDIACYVPKTGACASTADCVYGMGCRDGRCAPPDPAGLGASCDAAAQQLCTTPGATCVAYTAPDSPSGAHCTLPVGMTCTGDPECTCYKCFYPNATVQTVARSRRASANTKACCFPNGHPCQSDGQCCVGLSCAGGVCGGTICAPLGGECVADADCCNGIACGSDGVCGCNVCASGCRYTSIAAAIQAGETDIRVGAGTYAETNLPAPAGASLRIRPCGTGPVTIDAQQQGRVMAVSAGKSVTFEGMTLKNGKVGNAYGGALSVASGGTLTLDGTTVSDSQANWGGGGVANEGGTLVLRDSIVTRCSGGQYAYGGGVYSDGSNGVLTIERGEISHNAITGYGWGGGIGTIGGSAMTLTGVHIHDNSAGTGIGGGINVEDFQSTRIVDCRIVKNSGNFGGGVYVYNNHAEITGGEISDNVAVNQPAVGSGYNGGRGGGVHLFNGSLTLTDVAITGNLAKSAGTGETPVARGGGVYIGNGDATVTIAGTTRITGNRSEDVGDGIHIYGGNVSTSARVNTVVCAGASGSCSNPPSTSTGATNCSSAGYGTNTFTGCGTACEGGPNTASSSGVCPPA